MSESKILVIGSSNTDMVICTGHLPLPGETVIGGTFFMNPGGKGANQAVTVARLGGRVSFICKTGSDSSPRSTPFSFITRPTSCSTKRGSTPRMYFPTRKTRRAWP